MAVVVGPLMSVDATGTFAGAAVYSHWKGRNTVRRHAVPANPRSVGQLSVRAMMKFLSQYWDDLSSAEQTSWDARAEAGRFSAFNAFVQFDMLRWGVNLLPRKDEAADMSDTAGVIDNEVATAGSRSVMVSIEVTTLNQNWGINIYRGLTAAVGTTRNELVQTIPAETAATFTWLDFPLTPNVAVYYRAKGFSEEGVIGNAVDDFTATPTT